MALLPSFMRRPSAMLKMKDAIARGLSVEGFIRELKSAGLSYRRTIMLADWRSAAGIEAKKDLVKYVRKDRVPSTRLIADVEWEFHKGKLYMYKFGYWMPGEDIGEEAKHGINIMSDDMITPAQAEREAWEKLAVHEQYGKVLPAKIRLVGMYHTIFEGFEMSEQ